jgi:hypothetical protein
MEHHDSLPIAPLLPAAAPPDRYVPLLFDDLKARDERCDWVWQGYLARGAVTLLTSLWKAGKSTLLSVLLSRLKTGGTVGGFPVPAGRAVVLSEEPGGHWRKRGLNLALHGHVHWFCQPFRGKPTLEQWLDLLGQIGRMHDRDPVALLAIDSLANLAPMRNENDSVEMLKSLTPLQDLTSRGVSVLADHHPRRGPAVPGQAARGSGALLGFADIIVEMQAVDRRNRKDRRRRLRSWSRFDATPPTWVIEWTADGNDYLGLGPSAEPEFERGWPVLQALLDKAEKPLTQRAIARAWPEETPAPSKITMWRWLGRAVKEYGVLREGRGTRREPHRYSVPGTLEKVQANLVAELNRRLGVDMP